MAALILEFPRTSPDALFVKVLSCCSLSKEEIYVVFSTQSGKWEQLWDSTGVIESCGLLHSVVTHREGESRSRVWEWANAKQGRQQDKAGVIDSRDSRGTVA